jgi:hypothetical protein
MGTATGDGGPQAGPLRVLAWAHVAFLAWWLGIVAVTGLLIATTWPMVEPAYLAAHGEPLPDIVMMFVPVMRWGVVFIGLLQIAMLVLNACVARWLATRRRWVACAVVSGLNWIAIPFGPVLGTCTLLVLNKDGVRASFR